MSKMITYDLPESQVPEIDWEDVSNEILTTPSTGQNLNWGSEISFDFQQLNQQIQDQMIEFKLPPITGMVSPVSPFPNLNPTTYWASKVEISINGKEIQVIYPDVLQMLTQFYYSDEDRFILNAMAGDYANSATRFNKSNTPLSSSWFLPLKSFVNSCKLDILTPGHFIKYKVFLNSLSQICNVGGLSGTPVCQISSANLISRVTKFSPVIRALKYQAMMNLNHYAFQQAQSPQSAIIPSGTIEQRINLTQVSGKVSQLFFMIRPLVLSAPSLKFTSLIPCSSFSIQNSSGISILGCSDISNDLNLLVQSVNSTASSYTSEFLRSIHNSYIYSVSFSNSPVEEFHTGKVAGYYNFTGKEILKINFPAGVVAVECEIQIYALVNKVLEQSVEYVQVLTA